MPAAKGPHIRDDACGSSSHDSSPGGAGRMTTSVLFFGRLAGLEAAAPSAPIAAGDFRDRLTQTLPELADPAVKMAVNQRLVDEETIVNPGDEIAFLPPMSGG